MVVADTMSKPILKVSMTTDSDSSSAEESKTEDTESREHGTDDDNHSTDNDLEESDIDLIMKNEGWADAVAKVLGSTKPKNKKTLVLSRAKKYSEVKKKESDEKPAFEVIDGQEIKPVVIKKDEKQEEPPVKKKKQEKATIRVKPNILEKDRERLLNKIATKGVVQLFNAVRNQQKTLEREAGSDDLTETKKEKILKKFDKRTFLDSLMGNTKSIIVDEAKKEKLKDGVKDEQDNPRWSALRDDFMMGAKMKDWDKESVEE